MVKTFQQLISDAIREGVQELFPWDLEELLEEKPDPLVVDIREADEYDALRIENSILAPRGILETCCDWDYAETIPELVRARDKKVVLVCRSGNRSVLAAQTMQQMGYQDVASLRTGIKGWNDSDLPLYNQSGEQVDADWADSVLTPPVALEQTTPR